MSDPRGPRNIGDTESASDPVTQRVRILGIETSCDETAAAVVENGRRILSNVVASQAELHARFGGVFPEVASRQHILTIYPIVEQALQDAHLGLNEVDAICATRGPGLPGSLVVGLNLAKGLALACEKPLIGINHIEAHLYSAWLTPDEIEETPEPEFPLLALVVSGGHTELILMSEHLLYTRLGGTLDDAAGEAFDKIGRLLDLGYPGGPAIEAAAMDGDPEMVKFPRAWLEDTWDFSFSGLKTSVLHVVRRLEGSQRNVPISDIAASFQNAVVDVLVGKTLAAAAEHGAKSILVAGGVSANLALRATFQNRAEVPVYIPRIEYCTDNAAMIAAAGYQRHLIGQRDELDIDALPTWPISELATQE